MRILHFFCRISKYFNSSQSRVDLLSSTSYFFELALSFIINLNTKNSITNLMYRPGVWDLRWSGTSMMALVPRTQADHQITRPHQALLQVEVWPQVHTFQLGTLWTPWLQGGPQVFKSQNLRFKFPLSLFDSQELLQPCNASTPSGTARLKSTLIQQHWNQHWFNNMLRALPLSVGVLWKTCASSYTWTC